jgi:hypothetical protein
LLKEKPKEQHLNSLVSLFSPLHKYSILLAFLPYISTFQWLNNTSSKVSFSPSTLLKYLINLNHPSTRCHFCLVNNMSTFFSDFFTCSLLLLHPLEQTHQDGYCKHLPSLMQVRKQGKYFPPKNQSCLPPTIRPPITNPSTVKLPLSI